MKLKKTTKPYRNELKNKNTFGCTRTELHLDIEKHTIYLTSQVFIKLKMIKLIPQPKCLSLNSKPSSLKALNTA